jgi:hypothetical protein
VTIPTDKAGLAWTASIEIGPARAEIGNFGKAKYADHARAIRSDPQRNVAAAVAGVSGPAAAL